MSVSFQNAGQEQRVDFGEEQTHVLKTSFFSCCGDVFLKLDTKYAKTTFLKQKLPRTKLTVGHGYVSR